MNLAEFERHDKEQPRFDIEVPQQGIHLKDLTTTSLGNWISEERELFNHLAGVGSNTLSLNGRTFNRTVAKGAAAESFQGLEQALKAGEIEKTNELLQDYLRPARELRRIVHGGVFADLLLAEIQKGNAGSIHFPMLVYSDDFQLEPELMSMVTAERILRLSTPSSLAATDILNLKTQLAAADDHQKRLQAELQESRTLFATNDKEFQRLKNLYRDELLVKNPSVHWQNVYKTKTTQWRIWLGLFVFLVAVPLAILMSNADVVAKWVTEHFEKAAQSSGVAFSMLVTISIPAIAYAWVLKQVIRVYHRAFDLAVDADHRKSLAVSFLGLASDKDAQIKPEDRLVILHALFRPQPPHLSEEGPPTTLLELLYKSR